MASMVVAKASNSCASQISSSVTIQEKGSRNKRKFRADPPLGDLGKIASLTQNDGLGYEFSADKFEIASCHGQSSVCDLCSSSSSSGGGGGGSVNVDHSDSGLKLDLRLSSSAAASSEVGTSHRPMEEPEPDEFQDADWSDLTESQLEGLVLSNLDTIFRSAIRKIIACGYTEEIATRAVLRSGLCYGSKDMLSNIVDNTLAFLRSGQELDPFRDHWFEDLQQLEKYVLAELVCVLREVRPFFSTGDAMWCLLICDMNVSLACAMEGDPMSGFSADGSSNANYSTVTTTPTPQLKAETADRCKPVPSSRSSQPEAPTTKPKEVTNSAPETTTENKPFGAAEEKFGSSRRVHSMSTKRDYMLRQKSLHLDKTYRTYGPKGSSRSAKLSSLLMDKKLKAVSSDSVAARDNAPPLKTNGNNNKPAAGPEQQPPPPPPPPAPKPDHQGDNDNENDNDSPVVTELLLSLSVAGVPYDESSGKWVPRDKKDEMVVRLAGRARELRDQTAEWTEWANQKVMQAARRLGKEKEELRSLRQERDEAERLRREKRALEESTVKKLSEMEGALGKAGGQVERANSTVRRLEAENAALRREMEAAGKRAAEYAASCREVARREKRKLVDFHAWERHKCLLQEELVAEKRRLSGLILELEPAKAVQEQFEAKWHQEEKANEDLLVQISSIRKERERIETSTKSREDKIRLKAVNNLRKYKDNIQRLEKEISQLRLKTDSPKIAALRRGIDGGHYTTAAGRAAQKPSHHAGGGVRRERECVMCLSEEMSVVFLPCAHQVVCTDCNELHEKQGMKDCPSCRSPIQRRVPVRYARSS